MSKPISSTALAAGILALLFIGTPDAQAKQQCSAAMPPNNHSYWSYRIIDGRKCWYEGKPGLSKSLLEWSKEDAKEDAKEERRQEVKQEPRKELKQELKEALKQESKQEPKPELKPAPKPELKEAQKEEAFARPAFRTKRETAAAEEPQDPLDAQAWAQEDTPTFEALWRSRAQSFR
jgi:hypothetical protein